jgi:methylmalonyl-CoA mutase N-terminal domain/subunit
MPGEYPYTRGDKYLSFQNNPWLGYQAYQGFGSSEDTKERYKLIEGKGESSGIIVLPVDLPTGQGYDSDHPISKGKVGEIGVAISTVDDMVRLVSDEDVQHKSSDILYHNSLPVGVALFAVMAERKGIPWKKARMDILGTRTHTTGHNRFPYDRTLKNEAECAKFALENFSPEVELLNAISGYDARDTGLNSPMEIAYVLSNFIAIVEEIGKLGVPPEKVAHRIMCNMMGKLDIFETAAKFRALRRMYSKIMRTRFGINNPPPVYTASFGSGGELTAQQPLNNIARLIIQGLGGVLGGAHRNHIPTYDEALWIPSEHAHVMSVRIQQMLFHELFITPVIDPLGGSYYVEWLTNELEKRAQEHMDEIEKQGGFIRCLENGHLKSMAESNYYKEFQQWSSGERVRVGMNLYVEEDEKITIPEFKVDPTYEERRIKELIEFKRRRDGKKVKEALRRLGEKLVNGAELVLALVEAARADCTMGEMMEVMRKQYGWIKIV